MIRIESALNQLGKYPAEIKNYYWKQKGHQQIEYDAQFIKIILAHLLGVSFLLSLSHSPHFLTARITNQ